MVRMLFSGSRFLMLTASPQAYSKQGGDLDVDATLQGFLRLLHERGGVLHCQQEVEALSKRSGGWLVTTADREFACETLINAAGSWAGELGRLAGLVISALRRKKDRAVAASSCAAVRRRLAAGRGH